MPLRDIDDLERQFDPLSPLSRGSGLMRLARQRRQSAMYDQAAEQELVGTLARRIVAPISAVGNLLDVPGSVVRDIASTVTGTPRNPLDQLLPWNWFNDRGRITGRDLNRQWGLAGKEDTWTNFAGGIGTEIALDPLTYFTGGLLRGAAAPTKAGLVAEKAGVSRPFVNLLVAKGGAKGPNTAKRAATLAAMAETDLMADVAPFLDDARRGALMDAYDAVGKNPLGPLSPAARSKIDEMLLGKQTGMGAQAFQGPPTIRDISQAQAFEKLMDEPLYRSMGAFAPLARDPFAAFDPFGEKWGDRLAQLGDARRQAIDKAPVVGQALRTLRAAFDPAVMQQSDSLKSQDIARMHSDEQMRALGEGHLKAAELSRKVQDSGVFDPSNPNAQDNMRAIRRFLERRTDEEWDAFVQFRDTSVNLLDEPTRDAIRTELEQFLPTGIQDAAAKKSHAKAYLQGVMSPQDFAKLKPNQWRWKAIEHFLENYAFAHVTTPMRQTFEKLYGDPLSTKNWVQILMKGDEAKVRKMRENRVATDFWQQLRKLPTITQDEIDARTAASNLPPELQSLGNEFWQLKSALEATRRELRQTGLNAEKLTDIMSGYFPRTHTTFDMDKTPKSFRATWDMTNPHFFMRKKTMRNIMGGTDLLNEISQDAATLPYQGQSVPMVGMAHRVKRPEDIAPGMLGNQATFKNFNNAWVNAAADYIKQTYGQRLGPAVKDGQIKQIARWVLTMDPRHLDEKVPFFNSNPMDDFVRYMEHARRTLTNARLSNDILALNATNDLTEIPGHAISLAEAIKQINPRSRAAARQLWISMSSDPEITQRLVKMGINPQTAGLGALKQLNVPKALVDDMVRKHASFEQPEEVNAMLQAYDTLTALFKNAVTKVWPAFHMRNKLSGAFQNAIFGVHDPRYGRANPLAYLVPELESIRLLSGREITGLGKHPWFRGQNLTDRQATDKLRELVFAHRVAAQGQGLMDDIGNSARVRQSAMVPGYGQPKGMLESIFRTKGPKNAGWRNWSPVHMAGVATEDDIFAISRLGNDVGNFTEATNRIAPFIAMGRQGMSPEEAARRVKMLQVDYSALTAFERQVMRRVIPFYSFTRKITPVVLDELVHRPGGALGQTIRTMNRSRNPDEVTPDYVAQTAAIPLSAEGLPEGTKRYLTGFGMMFEDPLQFLGGDPLLEAGSRLNPLIKAPVEWITGRSLFQTDIAGPRALEDLDPVVGRTLRNIQQLATGDREFREPVQTPRLMEFLLSNSPLSRALTTLRTATDPRKIAKPTGLLLNLGTGLRVTDVSPGAQDAVLRELSNQLMKDMGAKNFTRVYIPDEIVENMSPEMQRQAMILGAIQKRLAVQAKERKESRERGN